MSDPAVPDLRRLSHFVAVVKASGFTPAAGQLHLSQQALAPGPALGGAVTVVDIDGPVLVSMQALWQPHTSSAVRDLILADQVTAKPIA